MAEDQEIDLGTAGASGRREHERRKAKREGETRKAHPHIGGLLLRLQNEPQHEKAWATGAIGEELLAASLARRCPDASVLHDRRMPNRRTNIDHLAIARSGVYVIDAKRYKGKIEVRKRVRGEEKLFIAGRDKAKLVDGLKRQAEAVRAGLELIERPVPLHACFCFINPEGQAGGSGIPLFRTLCVDELQLLHPRKLAKRLNQPGEVDPEQVRVLTEALAELFPAA